MGQRRRGSRSLGGGGGGSSSSWDKPADGAWSGNNKGGSGGW